MNGIKRYDISYSERYGFDKEEDPNGEYVEWEDHAAAIAAKDAEIARLNHALEVKEEFYQDALHSHIVLARQRDELRAQLDTNLNCRAIPEGLLEKAADLLKSYQQVIDGCHSSEIERFDYQPEVQGTADELRALLGKS